MQPDKSLRRIDGIGSARESRLKKLGIKDLDDLAATNPARLADLQDEGLPFPAEQMRHWIVEAQGLVGVGSHAPDVRDHSFDDARKLATAKRDSFVLTVEHDNEGHVASSGISHVRSQTEDRWRGWSTTRLLSFVEQQTGVALSAESGRSMPADETAMMPPVPAGRTSGMSSSHSDLVIGGGTQSFEYVIDFPSTADTTAPHVCSYAATVTIRPVGSEERRQIAHTQGRHSISDELIVPVGELGLAPGVYELEIVIATSPDAAKADEVHLRSVPSPG